MHWITNYELFLFDFDGLLVNTEEIHYNAYRQMCQNRGFELPWSFEQYCLIAHYDSMKLRETLYRDLPALQQMEPDWRVLYAEKKEAVLSLLAEGTIHLMPGAAFLLQALSEKQIPCSVVTNSTKEQIEIIKQQNPMLNLIPYWFTRETYQHPKPNPECYLNAIAEVGKGLKKIIGFEDTPRGLSALMQTPAKPVFVSRVPYPELPFFIEKGVCIYSSLEDIG